MATTRIAVQWETEAVIDAFGEMHRVVRALAKCHGQRFRDLDRRIDDLLESVADGTKKYVLGCKWLGTHCVFTPPAEVTAILRDARRLGVI